MSPDPKAVSLVDAAPDDLPAHLREHLPSAEAAAARNWEVIRRRLETVNSEVKGLLRTSSNPGTPKTSRVMMLRHVAGQWSATVAENAACRRGCSHCCHIPVSLSETEAKLIAKRTGRQLMRPLKPERLGARSDSSDAVGYQKPCVFLKDGRCGIYEDRPFACRTLLNVDDVPTLCELVPGVAVPVPYANATPLTAFLVQAVQNDDFADIRDWFRVG